MTLHFTLGDVPLLNPGHHLSEDGLWVGFMLTVIYLEGFDAHHDGLPRGVNPYQCYGKESRKGWEAGWDQADRERSAGVWQGFGLPMQR